MKDKEYISTQGTKPCYIGGQAVIEGVMMRGKNMYSMAVRNGDGDIVIESQNFEEKESSKNLKKMPIVRGVFAFIDSMVLGIKIISRSAEMAGIEEEENPGKFEKFLTEKLGDKLNDIIMGISMVISVVLAVGLFMLLPVFIGSFFNKIEYISNNSWALGIIEGIIRLLIFILYIYIISLNKDIHRVFQYHGAEHKTINCLEHEEELTVENVKKYSRYHRRCGTSFLLIVMVISMIFFLFVNTKSLPLRFFSRVIFVPFIAGVSYEVIRWAGRSKSSLVEIVSYPGMKLQGLTTKEPEAEHIECAIKAMKDVLERDGKNGSRS
ncbi:DUF1385 domain-containing protein [Anaeropeptidivorans aminofermentans]|uniref:DUF1385 domain-containing protein n=1 Tax=Anaeropeptidivorans aminofermentans TaxID=2934315 RepID=UPI0020254085|nr:DUF1385 domain-containing protein [Anaeropeptidivorans aminofermentans]